VLVSVDELHKRVVATSTGARRVVLDHAEELRRMLDEGDQRLAELHKQMKPPMDALANEVAKGLKDLRSSFDKLKSQARRKDP
jgi:PHD/YefM family antitoxin component YafN of YafNO toxin-antitoxin module